MPFYSRTVAPWERRNEYYNNIQLGKDVKTQTEILSRQTKAMHAAQLAQTNATIVSQERINEGIESLGYGIESVVQGIAGLNAAFEWGISEVVWQIEQNRKELRSILEVLSAPLDTQGKELRKRAEEAYANGWFEDSLDDFLESERKNRYDFSIHISIGMIYLFNNINKEKALEYFDKAIKYASPKSPYHTSFALLHKALIKRDFGLLEESELCASEAMELSPDFAEAIYQCAQYNAMLSRPEKSMNLLNQVILLDTNYCEKVCSDEIFEPFRPKINKLFETLRKAEGEKARNKLALVSKHVEDFESLLSEIKNIDDVQDIVNVQDGKLHDCMMRIRELMGRNSYRDYLEINHYLFVKLQAVIHEMRDDITRQLSGMVQSHNRDISEIKSDMNRNVNNTDKNFSWVMRFGIFISIFFGIRGCWLRGPVASEKMGTNEFYVNNALAALWALIWIPALGITIAWIIYKLIASGVKSSSTNEATLRVAFIQTDIDRLKGYINSVVASDEKLSTIIIDDEGKY